MLETNQDIGQLIEPQTVAFTFDALGWYILMAVGFLIFGIMMAVRWASYKKNKYRREAIAQIDDCAKDEKLSINQVNKILKQVAVHTFGREKVAALYGREWVAFLNQKTKKAFFEKELADFLSIANYQKSRFLEGKEKELLKHNAVKWIENHRS
ncbi:DUF4381 domain-containing protein [Flammeovirgaceae bacterium SG7u.111]|nr:DUF4381 domain-containing protein [Flammeovirgaceae bacterium SG7u.132]WPO36267.1 DUF4381 domain-containing protein [Flammeovirgaceae bacterium SG7u.111]